MMEQRWLNVVSVMSGSTSHAFASKEIFWTIKIGNVKVALHDVYAHNYI